MYHQDRQDTFRAGTELFTLKLDKEVFERMLKEFPEMKEEINIEVNLRRSYNQFQKQTHAAIINKESKMVIRKFNEVAMEQNYDIQKQQHHTALKRKEVQYRRSVEFIYKDKRLRNAIPPQDSGDGDVKRFISANPKLAKILQKKDAKMKRKQSVIGESVAFKPED